MSSDGKEEEDDEEDICDGEVRLSSELCGELEINKLILKKN